MKRDKNGFLIITNNEELKQAEEAGNVQVSVFCKCCQRQLVVYITNAKIILFNNEKLQKNER